jgi:hypothetical protein
MSRSPASVAVLLVVAVVALAGLFRFRTPWPYVLAVAVILSHLLLDRPTLRIALAEFYTGEPIGEQPPGLRVSVPAEICVYGLPLVLIAAVRGSLEGVCGRAARIVLVLLGVASIAAALTRQAAIWAPVYVVSVSHALILLRRHLSAKLMWNVLPLLPVVALFTTAGIVALHQREAQRILADGRYEETIQVCRKALKIPCRHGRSGIYVTMGSSYEELGDLAAAAQAYQQAQAMQQYPDWPDVLLAAFYCRHKGTNFYRPGEAARLYKTVISSEPTREPIKRSARNRLEQLYRRRLIPRED